MDESVGGARVFREKEKRGSSARVSRRNRWLNRAVKQLASSARGMGRRGARGKIEGRVKKVGLRKVQAESSSLLLPLLLMPARTERELIARITSHVDLATRTPSFRAKNQTHAVVCRGRGGQHKRPGCTERSERQGAIEELEIIAAHVSHLYTIVNPITELIKRGTYRIIL